MKTIFDIQVGETCILNRIRVKSSIGYAVFDVKVGDQPAKII